MRLIDADAFNDWILSHFKEPQSALILTLQGFIAEQPTAYDIDKVVEELEELRKKDVCDYLYCDVCAYTDKCSGVTDQSNNLKWDKAIEIVKHDGAGKDVSK